MYDWETYQTAYQSASPEVQAVLDSEIITTCVTQVIITKQLDASHFSKLVRIYCLHLTGTITEQAAEEEMLRLGIPDKKEVLSLLHSCIETKPSIPPNNNQNTTNHASDTLLGIRTMAGDMAKTQAVNEVVYSSSQEALLREAMTVPKAPEPKPTEGSWG